MIIPHHSVQVIDASGRLSRPWYVALSSRGPGAPNSEAPFATESSSLSRQWFSYLQSPAIPASAPITPDYLMSRPWYNYLTSL